MIAKVLLAAIFLFPSVGGWSMQDSKAWTETMRDDDWAYVCEHSRVFYGTSCDNVAKPIVMFAPFPASLAGEYTGGNYIILNGFGVSWAEKREVEVHEATHYLLYKSNHLVDKCKSEEAARRTTDSYMHRPYSDKWRAIYGCAASWIRSRS